MNRTVRARANWMGGMRVDAETERHHVIIDQPETMGGQDKGANPMEYLLFTLGSCLGTVAAIAARQQQIDLRGFSVALEGEYDSDYLMGKTTEGRAGFDEIHVTVDIDADLTHEEKQAFLDVVDSRCPVTDNILHDTKIKLDLQK